MNTWSLSAAVAVALGVGGLALCVALMSQSMPGSVRWWSRTKKMPTTSMPSRRVVTGAPAADRLGLGPRPARQPALRPDVLRRERVRLTTIESRRLIEQMADEEPERLANIVGALLASDQSHDDGTSRKGPR